MLAHLDVVRRFDILRGSWGGIIGSYFASKKARRIAMIDFSECPSEKEQLSDLDQKLLRKLLSQEMQDLLDRNKKPGRGKPRRLML